MAFHMALWLMIGLAQPPNPADAKNERLLAEIKTQARKSYALYNNMNVRGSLELARKSGEVVRYTIDYSGNGPLQSYAYSAIQVRDGEKAYLDRIILAASPKDHYVCRRLAPTADYYIESKGASSAYFVELALSRLRSVMSPCFVGPFSLTKLVESPYFVIEKTERLERDGMELLKLGFRVTVPPDASRRLLDKTVAESGINEWTEDRLLLPEPALETWGWMILDPRHGYIVHESEVDTMLSRAGAAPRHCSSRIEYEDDAGIPVPKRTFVTYLGNYSFTLESHDFKTKEPSYFTLGRLGLGDVPTRRRGSPVMYSVYLVLAAASVSALTWLFLRGRSRRADRTVRSEPRA